jgi:hypothetical protein
MIICDAYKFIFLGSQKTGTTSIRSALYNISQNYIRKIGFGPHIPAVLLREEAGQEKWNKYFKFAFVRNPWDREVSYFCFKKPNNSKKYIKNKNESFLKFVNTYVDSACWKFVCDNNYNQIVDFVGRFENLQNDFDKVCDVIKISRRKLPLKLQTRKNNIHYSAFYKNLDGNLNEELIEAVRNKWAKDIEIFNYEFEGK